MKVFNSEAGPRPMFSFVVPVYDRTQKLRESLFSLLHQTDQSFEIIVVTDGSPDETLAVLQEYRTDNRVRIFEYRTNSGNACRGRNKAIDEARGKYICFHDSDDIAHPKRLERTRATIETHNADGIYGPTKILLDGTRLIAGVHNGQVFDPPEFSYEMLKSINLMMTCSVSVRRSLLLAYGGFRENMRYREDHELWLRLAFKGCKWVKCENLLSYYRVHGGNAELVLGKDDSHWYEQALFWHVQDY